MERELFALFPLQVTLLLINRQAIELASKLRFLFVSTEKAIFKKLAANCIWSQHKSSTPS
ncbi:hypothetical protein KSF78_0001641 [Schistosoma japonicum]|nr:hypothetical protein KSF78_0001641 [Schistosoma japonicum]